MEKIEIITVSEKGQIVIPKGIREEMEIGKGTKLLLVEKKGQIRLTKTKDALKNIPFTMLASEKALAKAWLSKEDEKAWKKLQKATL